MLDPGTVDDPGPQEATDPPIMPARGRRIQGRSREAIRKQRLRVRRSRGADVRQVPLLSVMGRS